MAKKRYRMTPRRRAALKKAQAASARKRRRGRVGGALRAVGTGTAIVGGAMVAYHGNRYIARPDQFVKESAAAGRAVGRGAVAVHRKVRKPKTTELKKSVKAVKQVKDWSKFGYL
jgi:hypothetical protein